MSPEEFLNNIQQKSDKIAYAFERRIPLMVGNAGKSHFKSNFQKGGFVDQNLKKWKPAKRIGKAKGAKGQYGTLLSARNFLYNSINYRVLPYQVVIFTRVPYAIVHNEGLRAGRGKGFKMPKRQFIGDSAVLNKQISDIIDKELRNILELWKN